MTTKELTTTPGMHYVILPRLGGQKCELPLAIDSTYAVDSTSEIMADEGIVSLPVYTCGYRINERFHRVRGIVPGGAK